MEVIEDDGGVVISGRVQALAQGIYEEFQNLVAQYGPQSITNIMPLVVNVLESLESSLADNKDHITALTEVNEENTQLALQYEKEKAKRKDAESRSVHLELTYENDLKDLRERNGRLELDIRVLSAKIKSQAVHITQLEERTEKLKEENKDLHDRNIECIKFIGTFKLAIATDTKRSYPSSPSFSCKSPGFEVFAPQTLGRRKRHLPAIPHQLKPAISDGRERANTIAEPPSFPTSVKDGSVQDIKNTASIHWEQQHALLETTLRVSKEEHGNQVADGEVVIAGVATDNKDMVGEDMVKEVVFNEKMMDSKGPINDNVTYKSMICDGTSMNDTVGIAGEGETNEGKTNEVMIDEGFVVKGTVNDSTVSEGVDVQNLSNAVVSDVAVDQSASQNESEQLSLFDELSQMECIGVSGMDGIISENQVLNSEKNNLTDELEAALKELRETKECLETTKTLLETITNEKDQLSNTVRGQEVEIKRLKQELCDEQDRSAVTGDVLEKGTGPDGPKITRLEVTRLLKERNEFKEKYLSLLEQIRMNDELFMFKKKEKKSRWLDYFTAVFSPAKRRQMEDRYAEASTPRKPILTVGKTEEDSEKEEESQLPLLPGAVGYSMTKVIPTFKKFTRKQEELCLTSVCWMNPSLDLHCDDVSSVHQQFSTATITTSRPLGNHEDHGSILCAAAINPTVYLSDCSAAVPIRKNNSSAIGPQTSTSLIWVVTSVPNLTRVTVIDAATMGEVVDTFPVCATPLCCICAIPAFDPNDTDIAAGLCNRPQQPAQKSSSPSPASSSSGVSTSKLTTVWMGAMDTGELYVHSAVNNWKRSIHADKLKFGVQSIAHLKGKAFVLLKNASVSIYRRFTDGEWNWDSPFPVLLSHKKDVPGVTCMAAARSNMWCAVGNCVTVISAKSLKVEATIVVNANKKAEVIQMVSFGDGMWMSFKSDSTIRLFHATSFNHMQDIDIAPPIRRVLSFSSEKKSSQMPIYISTLLATYNSLWVGTENGVIVTLSFGTPVVVAEESGWEVLKAPDASVETFDIRTDLFTDVSVEGEESKTFPSVTALHTSSQQIPYLSTQTSARHESFQSDSSIENSVRKDKVLSPFCSVDQMQLSIHCHINAVKCLVCVPGQVQGDAAYEPLTGALIDDGEIRPPRTAFYILSCGEGHLDLRTADKVLQALHTVDRRQDGQEDTTLFISEKNYIMVWEAIP